MIFIGLYNKDGKLLDDITRYHTGLEFSTAEFGYDSATFNITLDYARRLFYYLYPEIITVKITYGLEELFEGYVAKLSPKSGETTARGLVYLLEKVKIYDLWSSTDYSIYSPVKEEQFASAKPDTYVMENDTRLYVAAKKDTDYSLGRVGFWNVRRKNNAARRLTTFAFRHVSKATGSFVSVLQTRNDEFSNTGAVSLWVNTLAGSGVVVAHSDTNTNENIHFGWRPQLGIFLGEDGDQFLSVSGLRIGSTISISGGRLYGDEIIRGTLSGVISSVGFINTSTALVQSPQIDILNADYSGVTALDVLKDVREKSSIYGAWDVGIQENRMLYFKPKGTQNRTWYVDGSNIDFEKDIDAIKNSVVVKYKLNEQDTYTDAISEQSSIAAYGFTSQDLVEVDVTTSGLAQIAGLAYLTDNAYVKLEASLSTNKVKDRSGAYYPPSFVRQGDLIVLQNIPITLSLGEEVSFICARTNYTADDNMIEIIPDNPAPTLTLFLNLLKRE